MIHQILLALLAGALVGVNPYNAPLLHARLHREQVPPKRLVAETAAITLLALVLLVGLTWRFAGFISGRLTNGLLFLGLFALAGAFYSLRPLTKRREADPAPQGWPWRRRYLSDHLYYVGPAWIVATAIAMQQLTFVEYVLPFLAAASGILATTAFWALRHPAALPASLPRPGERTRASFVLASAYGAAAVIMLAGNLKLI